MERTKLRLRPLPSTSVGRNFDDNPEGGLSMLFALIICIVVQAASFIAAFWLTLSTINTLKKKGNDTKGHDILYLMFAVLGVTILLTDLTLFLQVHQLEMVILTCFR